MNLLSCFTKYVVVFSKHCVAFAVVGHRTMNIVTIVRVVKCCDLRTKRLYTNLLHLFSNVELHLTVYFIFNINL